jgi:microcystin-dependent protein
MIDRGLLNYPEQLAVRLSKMERDIKRNSGKSSNCSGGGIPGPKGDPGPAGPPNVLNIGTVVSGATASATITGTTPAQTLNLVLPKGDPGTPGTAATIAVGNTTTLTPGTAATVTNSGTSTAAVFDFGIPKGDKGDTGDPGAAATIAAGNVTTLPAGSSATVTNTGTSSAAVFEFGIPKGDKGDTGNPGAAATVAAGSTTTLPAGSSATVTNSGTSSAAVFDFGIPKGDTGAAGADGADGADGFSPIATVSKAGDTATISITDLNGTTTATITDGTDGAAATIAAGTTTTLAAGSNATVTNSGTSSAAVFDFGIPRGADGNDGAAATIAAGTTTTLSPGASATVTNSGTSSAAVFDFGIPQGTPGSAATIAAGSVTTLSPGSSATVTNSGTSSAAVFDFGIPQGATGATGPANTLSIGTVQSGATAAATITGTSPNQTLNLTLPKGDTGPKGDPGAGCPIGTIIPFAGSPIPDGYLVCDGSAVSRTTYADLFAVIGVIYGSGDGSTTFNLPNLKGRVLTGQDTNDTAFDVIGETGGEKTHQLTWDEMPSHTHGRRTTCGGRGATSPDGSSAGGYKWHDSNNGQTESAGSDQPHNNLQPYLVTNYIIKYRDIAGTLASVSNTYTTSTTDTYSASYINSVINGTNDLLNLIYPVGSVYLSSVNTSPQNIIGGVWSAITPAERHSSFNIGTKGSGTTTNNDVQVTTTGNPVFLTFDADGNPDSGTKWYRLHIYRDGTELCRRTAQSDGSASHNFAATLTYLDTGATAGTHTYRFQIYVGAGNINFEEDGAVERPNCNIVELGYPPGKYAWKRTS